MRRFIGRFAPNFASSSRSLIAACAILCAIAASSAAQTVVTGQVTGPSGDPAADAHVFLERDLESPLRATTTDASGTFRFEGVEAGTVGVFAIASGTAFGGESLRIPVGEVQQSVTIPLSEPDGISGVVKDSAGERVEGARIGHVVILGEKPVGIPFDKLESHGFSVPVSDVSGDFVVSHLPKRAEVAIKVNHIQYAQQAVTGIETGARNVNVVIDRGVFVMGRVQTRGSQQAVANASIVIRNTEPPHDSVETRTGTTGEFAVRLLPGLYLYQAASRAHKSPGWGRLEISGERSQERVNLVVTGVGEVAGSVMNARTGEPVAGARITLRTNGVVSAVTQTGQAGAFRFDATEGENIVQIDPVAGFAPPEMAAVKANVVAGKTLDMPEFWLAPIPAFSVRVLDINGDPAQGAIVSVLRPAQVGWRVTDGAGNVELQLASLPETGPIMAVAESRDGDYGALFAIDRGVTDVSLVQLLPLATVRGQVVSRRGRGIEGAVVASAYVDPAMDEPVILWRTVSSKDGAFEWSAGLPYVPQRCVARAEAEDQKPGAPSVSAASIPFTITEGGGRDIGNIVLTDAAEGETHLGKTYDWYDNTLLSGALPDRKALSKHAAVVMHCSASEAEALVESLESASKIVGNPDILFAMVVDGETSVASENVAILSGKAPGAATTYVIDNRGRVVLETFGLPPVRSLAALTSST